MAKEEFPKHTRRRLGISRKKEISKAVTATKLWIADQQIFNEFVGRRHTTPAQLLRDIVHDWAVTIRVSGQAKDTIEFAGPIRKLHQQIIAEELAPLSTTLTIILELLNSSRLATPSANADTSLVPSDQQDSALLTILQRLADESETRKEELGRLRAFAVAHYMLSGQNFAATWAGLDFIQRYIAEPILRADPAHIKDSFQASITHRDDARLEGLQMVEQMSLEFHYPDEYQLILINPSEVQP